GWVSALLPQFPYSVFLSDLHSGGERDECDLVFNVLCDAALVDRGVDFFGEVGDCKVDVVLVSDGGITRKLRNVIEVGICSSS
ncbi:hypothetical protein TNCT_1941, partial [Trichonephila clavata]